MGYHISWIAPKGRDGGIDIMAASDPLGTKPPRIKVQVKRQSQSVDVDGLRSFMAVLGDGDVGIFVSVGGFTKNAAEEARLQEKRKITLLDNEQLFDLWVEYYEKLKDEDRRSTIEAGVFFITRTVVGPKPNSRLMITGELRFKLITTRLVWMEFCPTLMKMGSLQFAIR
jgi:restriction system protein